MAASDATCLSNVASFVYRSGPPKRRSVGRTFSNSNFDEIRDRISGVVRLLVAT
jgi:hypothetical protein